MTVGRVKSYTRVVSTDDGESAVEGAELHLNEQQVADKCQQCSSALSELHMVWPFFVSLPWIASRIQHPSSSGW